MRSSFVIILFVLFACIAYTCWRIWRILPFSLLGKSVLAFLWLLCFLMVFLHYGGGDRLPMWLSVFTYETGTSWMIAFVYVLLVFLLLGLGMRLHLVPASLLKDSPAGTCLVAGLVAALLVYGNFHYRHKYREVIEIRTEKPLEKPLTVVLASDLHAGYHNRRPELARWVDRINAEQPDLVLFAGDILDGAVRPAREGNYAQVFRQIAAPVYACLGNHEYLAGTGPSAAFFTEAGIRLLRDSSAREGGICIIGRDDRSNAARKDLQALMPADTVFTLLLDHQPYHLEEAEACGVDFQFSGHTHHGQVWPGSWITDAMYEKAFGAHRRGNTRYYVSSGLGIWGGKFRIGTRSEFIVLHIRPGVE